MNALINSITEQYEAVRGSRKILLEYCSTIAPPHLLYENTSFGRGGSIRNLLVHIANVYEFWIAKNALQQIISFTGFESKTGIPEIVELFKSVDVHMDQYITLFHTSDLKQINYVLNGKESNVSGLHLFTHVITHEFHHKGQILSMSRHLGYIPVDTDIIR